MKKVICVIIAVVIMFSFAACGKSEKQEEQRINWIDVREEYGYIFEDSFWTDERDRVYSFEENGEYSVISGEQSYSGKWYLLECDGVISLELQGGLQEQYYLTKLSADFISMADEDGTQYSLSLFQNNANVEIPADMEEWVSDFGYSMAYDKSFFTLASNENGDIFRADGSEETLDELYLAVRRYSNNSPASLAGGIEIQSDYETAVKEEKVGYNGYAAVTVAYHTDTAEMKFYLIEAGDDVLEIEICVGDDCESIAAEKIESMLETLTVK